jgi:hypothetical protein
VVCFFFEDETELEVSKERKTNRQINLIYFLIPASTNKFKRQVMLLWAFTDINYNEEFDRGSG